MKKSDLLVVAAIVACYVLAAAYLAIPWGAVGKWMDKETSPSWIEAWGTILAVIAGAGAVYWQVKVQARTTRIAVVRAERDALVNVAALLRYGAGKLEVARRASRIDGDFLHYLQTTHRYAELENLGMALSETHPREVPGPGLKLSFISGRKAYLNALAILEDASTYRDGWEWVDPREMQRWRDGLAVQVGTVQVRSLEIERRVLQLNELIGN